MAFTTTAVLTAIAVGASLAGTGTAIYSAQQQAKSAENAAEYNAKLAENEARNVENEAAENAKRQSVQRRKEISRLRNELAISGTLTTSGTPLALLGESSANMSIGIQDAFRASNMQAEAYRSQGRMGLWEASQQRTNANLTSVGMGLSGISKAAGSYYDFNQQGAFTSTRTKNTSR